MTAAAGGGAPQYRNVLVIGGTSGLGRAVAGVFAPVAERVHLTYNGRREEAEQVAEEVAKAGGAARVHRLALPDPDARGPRVRELLMAAMPCDAVVNCAVANDAAVTTIANADRFKAVIDANIFGAYQVNAVSAQTLAASGGGTVVNVSSILTRKYITGAIGYITSKAAIEAMTRGFAREWGKLGLRFTTVSPGPIRDTRLLGSVPREAVEEIMGGPDFEDRLLPPERVADVIRAVTGPEFAAVNGEIVTVDEGFSL
ncbi:SDR family oxidoreductase [Nocardiopsis chromatogenes]|uniref:SDR family oxidoreductase n=1 Tax=Nocardiopsis chromatogenes TaxID=280239 RepID=UPI0003478E42|nr:SDR family oxidoreductase [Nocardiopsis chromatogenes]